MEEMTGYQSSLPSSSSRAIMVSSYAIVSSNRRLARRPRSPHSVVHMAGLHLPGYRRWLCATTGGVPERARRT